MDLTRLLRSEYKFDLVATREDGARAVQEIHYSILERSALDSFLAGKPRMVPDNLDATPIDFKVVFEGDALSSSQEAAFSFSTVDSDSKVVTPTLTDLSGFFKLEGSTQSDTWTVSLASSTIKFDDLLEAPYAISISLSDEDNNKKDYNIIINVVKS